MDKAQMVVAALCAYLFASDIMCGFNAPPSPKKPHSHSHSPIHAHEPRSPVVVDSSLPIKDPYKFTEFQPADPIGRPVVDAVVHISFCTSCSYKGTALTIKKMLENSFPGITVELTNYPPSLPKRLASKAVPVLQIGSVVLITAGEHIFPRLGYTTLPPWYYSLKQKKFGVIATSWLLGNSLQSYLQSTGAFEVVCNGQLVFSKLQENRFPGEIELRELIGRTLGFASPSSSDRFY